MERADAGPTPGLRDVSSSPPPPSPQYVEARRVLLDALDALGDHRDALVLVGAQAIYLRAGTSTIAVAPHTTDGDIAIDPQLLPDVPPLGEAMTMAGFTLSRVEQSEEPGIWEKVAAIDNVDVGISVDLIVPDEVAQKAGRRGARLGPHGNRAARKIRGLEAALVDKDPMRIESLDSDERSLSVNVAGFAALLVAKIHKIRDRVADGREHRQVDKDAADVIRIMQCERAQDLAVTIAALAEHPVAGISTRTAAIDLANLFGKRGAPGIRMAGRALQTAIPEDTLSVMAIDYTQVLNESWDEAGVDFIGKDSL